MRRTIGIVGEGPTDYLVIKACVDKITGEENTYRRIQPEQDMTGEYGNGWKGVFRWCESNGMRLDSFFTGDDPLFDILIIQMDADVSRKEKEVHCMCENTVCDDKGSISPLNCGKIKNGNCPVALPCKSHKSNVCGHVEHIEKILLDILNVEKNEKVVILVPCDSTDAWVVAAYDDFDNIEDIKDPWETVIASKKEYHGTRVNGHKKNVLVYQRFALEVAKQWDIVSKKCRVARVFEESIRSNPLLQ